MAIQKPDSIEFFAFLDEDIHQQPEWQEIKEMTSKALSMCTPLELVSVLNIFAVGLGLAKEKQWNESVQEDMGSGPTVDTVKTRVRHKDCPSDRLIEITESIRDNFSKAVKDMKLIDAQVNSTKDLVNSKEVASA